MDMPIHDHSETMPEHVTALEDGRKSPSLEGDRESVKSTKSVSPTNNKETSSPDKLNNPIITSGSAIVNRASPSTENLGSGAGFAEQHILSSPATPGDSASQKSNVESPGKGPRRSMKPVKRQSDMMGRVELPPVYDSTTAILNDDSDESPSYNGRRSLNLTSNDSIFDNTTQSFTMDQTVDVKGENPADDPKSGSNLPKEQGDPLECLKTQLSQWFGIVIGMVEILMWKKKWYPMALVGANTLLFFIVWWIQIRFLTIMAFLGALLILGDFFLPFATHLTGTSAKWSPSDEMRFDAICRDILAFKQKIRYYTVCFTSCRTEMPRSTSLALALFLLTGAWFFAKVDNTLFLYLLTTSALLFPGLQDQGVFRTMKLAVQCAMTRLATSKTSVAPSSEKILT